MEDGATRGGAGPTDGLLKDVTYDGERRGGALRGGLGQLNDGELGHTNYRLNYRQQARGGYSLIARPHQLQAELPAAGQGWVFLNSSVTPATG